MADSDNRTGTLGTGDGDRLRLPETWIESFTEDVGYLWCPPKIDILRQPPSALDFYRDYVAASRPCIIRNAILDPITPMSSSGPQQQQQQGQQPLLLTLDDIMERLDPDETLLTVDVTPDGHGDCVRQVVTGQSQSTDLTLMFVQPKEVRMSLREFYRRLRRQQQQLPCEREQQNKQQRAPDMGVVSQSCDVNNLPSVPLLDNDPDTVIPRMEHDHSSPHLALPDNSIVYYSRQNDCLRTPDHENDKDDDKNKKKKSSITDLAALFPASFDWASFGTPLEAVNLWMGNACSVSSMHKDHYENLFYVASGEKVFTLCPPADAPFLYPQGEYVSGQFDYCTALGCKTKDIASKMDDDGDDNTDHKTLSLEWRVKPLTTTLDSEGRETATTTEPANKVRWIYPDISTLIPKKNAQQHSSSVSRLLQDFSLLRHAHPMEIKVQAGEMLYLPSLWFHRVTQTCETIGINYWYDMRFDGNPLWCYFNLLQEMTIAAGLDPPTRTQQKQSLRPQYEQL